MARSSGGRVPSTPSAGERVALTLDGRADPRSDRVDGDVGGDVAAAVGHDVDLLPVRRTTPGCRTAVARRRCGRSRRPARCRARRPTASAQASSRGSPISARAPGSVSGHHRSSQADSTGSPRRSAPVSGSTSTRRTTPSSSSSTTSHGMLSSHSCAMSRPSIVAGSSSVQAMSPGRSGREASSTPVSRSAGSMPCSRASSSPPPAPRSTTASRPGLARQPGDRLGEHVRRRHRGAEVVGGPRVCGRSRRGRTARRSTRRATAPAWPRQSSRACDVFHVSSSGGPSAPGRRLESSNCLVPLAGLERKAPTHDASLPRRDRSRPSRLRPRRQVPCCRSSDRRCERSFAGFAAAHPDAAAGRRRARARRDRRARRRAPARGAGRRPHPHRRGARPRRASRPGRAAHQRPARHRCPRRARPRWAPAPSPSTRP